jgi:MFS transporter, DHA2 family, multidrug resistance protein
VTLSDACKFCLPFFLLQAPALALAYFEAFLIFAVVAVVLAFLVLLMKRSVAEKGAHTAAE